MPRGPKVKDKSSATPLRGVPEPPEHLDGEALVKYREIAGLIEEAGVCSELDRDTLTIYAETWALYREATERANLDGRVIEAPNGVLQHNPWHKIAIEAQKDLKYYMRQLGLSPAARQKLVFELETDADNKWSSFDS